MMKPKKNTAIPEEPFNNKFGTRAGKSDGSFCELSKFGTKSTCTKWSTLCTKTLMMQAIQLYD